MARAALGRALVASGGTILAIGGATMLVSTVSMGVARAVVMERKVKGVCIMHGGGRGRGVCLCSKRRSMGAARFRAHGRAAAAACCPAKTTHPSKTKQKKLAVSCEVCKGRAKVPCDVCGGGRALRYHPFVTLAVHARAPLCVCAMCAGKGEQTCLNCLGDGVTYPP
jgi:hypothetical protein